jgi:hypothetical protein
MPSPLAGICPPPGSVGNISPPGRGCGLRVSGTAGVRGVARVFKMPHPLCFPPPRSRGGAGGPERSGGPRRGPSLKISHPSLSPPPRCASRRVQRAATWQRATEYFTPSLSPPPRCASRRVQRATTLQRATGCLRPLRVAARPTRRNVAARYGIIRRGASNAPQRCSALWNIIP